jgi:hypothetical protein
MQKTRLKYKLSILCRSLGFSLFLLFCVSVNAKSQEPPPRPIAITVTAQTLSFGAFSHGAAGGTVSISSGGIRTAGGDIILLGLGFSFSTTLYEIVANQGTIVSLLNGPDVLLAGSNGGSITLSIGASSPVSPFVTTASPPTPTELDIGGTITIGNAAANPPGNYSGTYDITFIQE